MVFERVFTIVRDMILPKIKSSRDEKPELTIAFLEFERLQMENDKVGPSLKSHDIIRSRSGSRARLHLDLSHSLLNPLSRTCRDRAGIYQLRGYLNHCPVYTNCDFRPFVSQLCRQRERPIRQMGPMAPTQARKVGPT